MSLTPPTLASLINELEKAGLRQHLNVPEDSWYSCPKSADGCLDPAAGGDCNCGADAHNKAVESAAAKLRLAAATV